MEGFSVEVTTDKDRYGPAETVQIAARVCRTAASPITTSSTGGTGVLLSFRLLDARSDAVVADSSHYVLTMELRSVSWLPGQCRTWAMAWDQHRWNQDPAPQPQRVFGEVVRGPRVSPGVYRVEIQWVTAVWDDTPKQERPVESPTFEIATAPSGAGRTRRLRR